LCLDDQAPVRGGGGKAWLRAEWPAVALRFVSAARPARRTAAAVLNSRGRRDRAVPIFTGKSYLSVPNCRLQWGTKRVLCNLDKMLSPLQCFNDSRKHRFEPNEQFALARVPQSNPHNWRAALAENCPPRKIRVFRDDDAASVHSMLPNGLIFRAAKPSFGDMFRFMSCGRKAARKRWRQLCVEEKTHQVTFKPGWSLWCAAYSRAALISASSR